MYYLICLEIILCLIVSYCSATQSDASIYYADTGLEITTQSNHSFQIRLVSKYGNGSQWVLREEANEFLTQDSVTVTRTENTDVIIGNDQSYECFHFTSIKVGRTDLVFYQLRAWEPHILLDSFQCKVLVQN